MFKAPTKWLLKGPYLYASFRFPAIRFDAPTLLSFRGCPHAHAKCPPVSAEGAKAFNDLLKLVARTGDRQWVVRCEQALKEGKQYLKTDYKVDILEPFII